MNRVLEFDPDTDCYIIADVPNVEEKGVETNAVDVEPKPAVDKVPDKKGKGKVSSSKKSVPAETAKATAVPIRAGG